MGDKEDSECIIPQGLHVIVYFDSAFRQKKGNGGFMIYGPEGYSLQGKAIWFSNIAQTNNELEVHTILSVVRALCVLHTIGLLLVELVMMIGKSDTMIKCL